MFATKFTVQTPFSTSAATTTALCVCTNAHKPIIRTALQLNQIQMNYYSQFTAVLEKLQYNRRKSRSLVVVKTQTCIRADVADYAC